MSEFNLRVLIREVAATSSSTDPGDLANEVFQRIDRKNMVAAVKEMLRNYVRQIVSADRMPEPPALLHESSRDPVIAAKPGNRSWKRDGVKKGWKQQLRDRIHVGPESSAWKFLGQCTYDDLVFAADERRHAAERTLARADFYEGLAKLLKDHAVATVEELPEDVLAVHLGNEGGEPE